MYEILKKFTIKTEILKNYRKAKKRSSRFSAGGSFSEDEPHPEESQSRIFSLKPLAAFCYIEAENRCYPYSSVRTSSFKTKQRERKTMA